MIDALQVAKDTGMGGRINTMMQTCFFAISGVLPREEAIERIKYAIKKTYGKRGEAVVQKNFAAVDAALDHLDEVTVPAAVTSTIELPAACSRRSPGICAERARRDDRRRRRRPAGQRHAGRRHLSHRHGAMGEAQHRARDPGLGRGPLHPVRQVRAGLPARRDPRQGLRVRQARRRARDASRSPPARWKECADKKYTLQVAPEDCTGCELCVEVCPVKSKSDTSEEGAQHGRRKPPCASRSGRTGTSS